MRTRPTCTYVLPWLAVRLRLQLAKVYLAASDATTAHHLMREIDDILLRRPNLGTLTEDVPTFRASLPPADPRRPTRGPPLSPAELRLLPYLQTHLTLP